MKFWLKLILLISLLSVLSSFCIARTESEKKETKVLDSRTIITVLSDKKIRVFKQEEIFVANESDKRYGADSVRETDFREMKKLKAIFYDASGKIIRKLNGKDIQESSLSAGVHDKHKTKFYDIRLPLLPYRIVRTKEYEIKTLFFGRIGILKSV